MRRTEREMILRARAPCQVVGQVNYPPRGRVIRRRPIHPIISATGGVPKVACSIVGTLYLAGIVATSRTVVADEGVVPDPIVVGSGPNLHPIPNIIEKQVPIQIAASSIIQPNTVVGIEATVVPD